MHVGKPWRKNSVPQDAIQGKINIGKALDGISDNYLLSPEVHQDHLVLKLMFD